MAQNLKNVLAYSNTWLDIIKQSDVPERKLGEWIISESIDNFRNHFNE